MIINHTHRFIFVHIPKTAGTTASQLFSRFSSYRDLEIGGTPMGEAMQDHFYRRHGLRKHSVSADIRKVVGDEVWSGYFTFAFVRNPLTRATSAYTFLKRWRLWNGSEIMDTFPSVNDFIVSDYWQTPGHRGLLLPQVDYLTAGVDYVGRVEDFEASIDHIAERIGLPPFVDKAVAWRNETRERAELDERSRGMVIERYREDFEAFGYSVDQTATSSPSVPTV